MARRRRPEARHHISITFSQERYALLKRMEKEVELSKGTLTLADLVTSAVDFFWGLDGLEIERVIEQAYKDGKFHHPATMKCNIDTILNYELGRRTLFELVIYWGINRLDLARMLYAYILREKALP